MAALLGFLWGPVSIAFYVGQAAVSFFVHETYTYIQHYGLNRNLLPDGRFEPATAHHSWNARFSFSNIPGLNIQFHADHHARPNLPFANLVSTMDSPQLPFGYPAMFLLALIPPLWRSTMDCRVPPSRSAHALS